MRRISKTHLLDCDTCEGAGMLSTEHPHDPDGDLWDCDDCRGRGQTECSGCDACEEDRLQDLWEETQERKLDAIKNGDYL